MDERGQSSAEGANIAPRHRRGAREATVDLIGEADSGGKGACREACLPQNGYSSLAMTSTALITLAPPGSNIQLTLAAFRGAIVTSLCVGGRELLYLDEATFADPSKNVRGGIPVLFPTPGKLAEDHWQHDGRQGVMKQHGFARNCAWTVAALEAAAVTLKLQSDTETLLQYPWPFEVLLRLELDKSSMRIITRVCNTGGEPMPFALGFHPYFKTADKSGTRIESHATRAFNNLTGKSESFTGFDLTAAQLDLHLLDHPDPQMKLELEDGATITVRASADFRRWVLWTLAGKDFVCVEPWTAPGNALNTAEDLIVLPPAGTHESWVEVSYEER